MPTILLLHISSFGLVKHLHQRCSKYFGTHFGIFLLSDKRKMPAKVITQTIPLGESFPDHMEKQKVDNTRDLKTISGSYQISKSMISDDNNNNNNNYNKLNNRVQENKKLDNPIKSDTTKLTNNTYNASQNKQRKFLWMEFETPLIWLNIISILGFHLVAAWGFICFPYISRFPISLYTVLWGKSST